MIRIIINSEIVDLRGLHNILLQVRAHKCDGEDVVDYQCL